jgi:hypothetical protein
MLTWARLRHGDILLRHRSEHRCGRGHDGQPDVHPRRQTRRHAPDSSNNIAYNVALFSQAGLANGEHQLTATATPGPTVPSLILFDYAIYTYEEFVSPSSSTSASASSTSSTFPSFTTTAAAVVHHHTLGGAIGGAVGGGLVVIAALLALLLCLRRRRRPEQPAPAVATTAAIPHSPPHPDVGAGGMDPYAGHHMPPPAAYGTAPMWTSSSSAPKQSGSAYGPASYAKSGPGSYASRDMVGPNSHVAPLVDSGYDRTPFSNAPSTSAGRSSTDALSALSARGGPYSPTFALPSDVSTSTAPDSSAAPSSSPQAPRRLPPPPVQNTTVRRYDTLLTRGGTIKTTSEVPPAYAPGWDHT